MTREQEQALIARVVSGDMDAFEPLVTQYESYIYNVALKLTGNPADAMDISQDVFFKAYQNLASFRGDSRLSVWLYRLTYNACIDLGRKQQRRSAASLTVEDEDAEETELPVPDSRWDPQSVLEKEELQQAVSRAMDELPAKLREILTLREFSDLSYEEIARVLGITTGTVKSRLARARTKLGNILLRNGTFSESERHKIGKEGK